MGMRNDFEVRFGAHTLVGDELGADLPRRVLMLHGAGEAHRGKMLPLRRELEERGFGSVAFDFVGHGETGGELSRSSLAERTAQARVVIRERGLDREPLAVIAASMGAHTAVMLTERVEVDRLVLVVPAMYATEAYGVRFDAGFTEIIRRPGSWETAYGWEVLGRFAGKLLVIAAERDAVIPGGVIDRYHEGATSAASRVLHTIPGVGHMCFTELRETDPAGMAPVLDVIVATVS